MKRPSPALHGRHAGVFFSPEAIRAYRAKYVSSTDLARSEGKPTEGAAIARDLKAIGIGPVSGPGVD